MAIRRRTLTFETLVQFLAALMLYTLFLWPKYISIPLGPLRLSPYNLAVIGAFAMAVIAIFVRKAPSRIPPLAGMAMGLFLVFFATRFLSDGFSSTKGASFYSEARFLIWTCAVFPIAVVLYARTDDLSKIGDAICVCMVVVSGAVLLEVALHTVFPAIVLPHIAGIGLDDEFKTMLLRDKSRDGGFRAQGLFNHPIVLGQIGAAMLPLALARLMSRSRRKLHLVTIASCLIAIAFCGARTGQVAAVVGLVAFGTFLIVQSRSKSLWALSIIVLPIATAIVTSAYAYVAELVVGRTAIEQGSSEVRAMMWMRGWPAIWEKPVFGHGAGNAPFIAGTIGGNGVRTIDDFYLSLLVDTGFAGLFAFGAFAAMVLFSSLAAKGSAEQRRLRVALMAGIVAILAAQKAVSITQGIGIFMFLSGLLLASQIHPARRGGKARLVRQPVLPASPGASPALA
ncbi:O-antigen ligase family protein [Novosphingobium sp. 1949]|uniref:O-antigen ligase family protein n=1 Tax=Novosphingobium organovorum TaxID=2930092 RepID=A0ABT0BDR3_9SPHN|nr:O-antigen ligase family protein [Novosphingobium organovorum]MCJ2183129.1 O-antigen ligase family protein [Novosphingobium organovorum]